MHYVFSDAAGKQAEGLALQGLCHAGDNAVDKHLLLCCVVLKAVRVVTVVRRVAVLSDIGGNKYHIHDPTGKCVI